MWHVALVSFGESVPVGKGSVFEGFVTLHEVPGELKTAFGEVQRSGLWSLQE
jgi:hypothetical protein